MHEAAELAHLMEGTPLTERSAAIELARDDVGWLRLGGEGNAQDLSPASRAKTVRRSRTYAKGDSICKQTIRLYVDYIVGKGIDWAIRNEKGQGIIEEYTTSVANRKLFKAQGQRETTMKLLIDGELFKAIFNAGDPGESKGRYINPLQIVDIATDPEDESTPRWYKRKFMKGRDHKVLWYPDYTNEKLEPGEDSEGKTVAPSWAFGDRVDDVVIIHTALDKTGRRGEPLLTASIDEAKANRQFMRARLAIVLSLAQFVWKLKMKGGQAAINAVVAAYDSTLSTGDETRPPASPGSTAVENEGLTRTPIKQETGAQSASIDGAMLLQRFGAGVGIYPHYYGAGEAFRLATATAMELPMLKTFGGVQQLVCDMYAEEFQYIMQKGGVTDLFVDTDPPPILVKDAAKLVHAMFEGAQIFPALTNSEEIFKLLLTYIGVVDIDEVMEKLKEQPVRESHIGARLMGIQRQLHEVAELYESLKGGV